MRMILAIAALVIGSPAMARTFTIGGEAFAESDIIDARALPSMDGMPTVLISFSDAAAARLGALTAQFKGKPMPIVLDGKTLVEPVVMEPIPGGAIEMNGVGSMAEAVALAKAISGKDPLPDSLDE